MWVTLYFWVSVFTVNSGETTHTSAEICKFSIAKGVRGGEDAHESNFSIVSVEVQYSSVVGPVA